LGSQQLSIHIKTLLDDLKSSKDYCPRNLSSDSNSSPEKSLQKNLSIFCLENQSCDRRYVEGIPSLVRYILAPLCVQYNNTTPQRLSSFKIEIVELSAPGVQEA